MSHEPDHTDDLDALREGLHRRADRDPAANAAGLYGRARQRADQLRRRQLGTGVAASVVVIGAVIGALSVNHGRATVGTELSGPAGTNTATSLPGIDGSTTTVGSGVVSTMSASCIGFPSGSEEATLTAHFGPRQGCIQYGAASAVLYGGPTRSTSVMLVNVCRATDTACLGPNATRDLADLRVAYVPAAARLSGMGAGQDGYQFYLDQPVVPDGKTFPVLGVPGSAAPPTSFELLAGCESQGGGPRPPAVYSHTALDPMTVEQALGQPVPDWSTIQPADWTTTC